MDWQDVVNARAKRKNKVLFMPDDAIFDALAPLTERAGRRALVLWALSLAEEALPRMQALLPGETRPMDAVRLARQWSRGEVKMPVAKGAILACHAVAKEDVSAEAAALCHAVGQACAVVHARGHAMGFAVYELTAIARRAGTENCAPQIEARVCEYMKRLQEAQARAETDPGPWANSSKRRFQGRKSALSSSGRGDSHAMRSPFQASARYAECSAKRPGSTASSRP